MKHLHSVSVAKADSIWSNENNTFLEVIGLYYGYLLNIPRRSRRS